MLNKCSPISRFFISVCVILAARCLILLQNTFHCLSVDGLTSVFIKLNNLSPLFNFLQVNVKLSFSYVRMDVLITSKSVNTVWVNFKNPFCFEYIIWFDGHIKPDYTSTKLQSSVPFDFSQDVRDVLRAVGSKRFKSDGTVSRFSSYWIYKLGTFPGW